MSLLTTATLVVTPNANKTGKLYSVIPSNGNGDFTVTRATTATRVNSSGLVENVALNVPRLDYSLGSCPNLLLEPQRTNLAQRSEEFDNATWTKLNASITANATTSPSGVVNADKLIETATSGFHYATQPAGVVTLGATITTSVFVKSAERTYFGLYPYNSSAGVKFNLNTGVILSQDVGIVSASITSVGNGWYKISASVIAIATTPSPWFAILNNSGATSYAGDGTSGLFIWGAQLEAGAYATSYIPTTTASVTRNADSISLSNVYTNGLISASGGTWFVELRNNIARVRDAFAQSLFIGTTIGGVGTDGFSFTCSSGSSRIQIRKYVASVETFLYVTTTDTSKIAIKWNGTTADIFQNGTKVVTATAFSGTNMQWMVGSGTDVPKNINQMALWATPLTDTQLTQLTTL